MKLFDNVVHKLTLETEVYTTDTTGTAVVDTKGFNDGMLIVSAGDIATTASDRYTVKVMECDTTHGVFEDTGISLVFTEDDDNEVHSARIANLNTTRKRYLRGDLVCSATTRSFEGSVIIAMGEPFSGPVTQQTS